MPPTPKGFIPVGFLAQTRTLLILNATSTDLNSSILGRLA